MTARGVDMKEAQAVHLLTGVRNQKLSEDQVKSGIFHGITFCECSHGNPTLATTDIAKGNTKHSKADLEALVHKHGGEFTQQQLGDLSAYVFSPDNKSGSPSSMRSL